MSLTRLRFGKEDPLESIIITFPFQEDILTVFLVSSFDNWKKPHQMKKYSGGWKIKINSSLTIIKFKFAIRTIEGISWRVVLSYPHCEDEEGNLVNFIDINQKGINCVNSSSKNNEKQAVILSLLFFQKNGKISKKSALEIVNKSKEIGCIKGIKIKKQYSVLFKNLINSIPNEPFSIAIPSKIYGISPLLNGLLCIFDPIGRNGLGAGFNIMSGSELFNYLFNEFQNKNVTISIIEELSSTFNKTKTILWKRPNWDINPEISRNSEIEEEEKEPNSRKTKTRKRKLKEEEPIDSSTTEQSTKNQNSKNISENLLKLNNSSSFSESESEIQNSSSSSLSKSEIQNFTLSEIQNSSKSINSNSSKLEIEKRIKKLEKSFKEFATISNLSELREIIIEGFEKISIENENLKKEIYLLKNPNLYNTTSSI